MITEQVTLFHGDLDDSFLERAAERGLVAWDIETTALDWREGRIGTCQVAAGDDVAVVQLGEWDVPERLRALLEDRSVRKVFHHAPFDLRFMAHHWKAHPATVSCTKVAAKILNPGLAGSDYSLKPLLHRYLGVSIDKSMQVSDWSRAMLSSEQLAYAAADVRYLIRLYVSLMDQVRLRGLIDLVNASFDYLPTRVQLDLLGVGDVFDY